MIGRAGQVTADSNDLQGKTAVLLLLLLLLLHRLLQIQNRGKTKNAPFSFSTPCLDETNN